MLSLLNSPMWIFQQRISRLQEALGSMPNLRTSSAVQTALEALDPLEGVQPSLDTLFADPYTLFRTDASTSKTMLEDGESVKRTKIVFTDDLAEG